MICRFTNGLLKPHAVSERSLILMIIMNVSGRLQEPPVQVDEHRGARLLDRFESSGLRRRTNVERRKRRNVESRK